jgi:hypothetical protein
MVFEHQLPNDRPALLKTITTWPKEIYDLDSLMSSIQSESRASKDDPLLLECIGELYLVNRQPGKALPYFLRLRRPHVFDLIREHNLFTAVQDQALLLVEFDQERKGKMDEEDIESAKGRHGAAIQLLVDHTHSIPVNLQNSQLVMTDMIDRQSRQATRSQTTLPIPVPRLAFRQRSSILPTVQRPYCRIVRGIRS